MKIKAGSTGVSVYYYIVQDASGTSPGEPVTGLLFSDIETGGSASYARQSAARVDLTLITLASASATHADGGFILVDDTNMPGLYRCDYPDAAFITGVDQIFCQIVVASANNAVAAPILIDIDDNVDQTADNDILLQLTATSTALATAQNDLDTITGSDGVTLATAQALYAPSKAGDSMNISSIDNNAITALSIAASALDGKGNWNIGKTGYALTVQDWNTVTPPTTAQIWAETTRSLTVGVDIAKINGITIIGDGSATPFDV